MTGGQVHDSQVVEEILNTPRSPLAVTADKAYDSEKVRRQIKDEGALPIIPNRCSAIKKAYCPKRFYRRRHKIENFFCRIKDWRRIATRYESLARNFLAASLPSSGYSMDQIVIRYLISTVLRTKLERYSMERRYPAQVFEHLVGRFLSLRCTLIVGVLIGNSCPVGFYRRRFIPFQLVQIGLTSVV